MKKQLMVLLVVVAVIALGVGMVLAQTASTSNNTKSVIYVAADKAQFKPAPAQGVSMAPLFGDADNGSHATLTKFDPGYEAGMHTHTNDVWIIVLKGTYVYKDEAGEKRVGPGDFIRVPGGHKHSSAGDKTEGALFYEEGSGKFDLIPAK